MVQAGMSLPDPAPFLPQPFGSCQDTAASVCSDVESGRWTRVKLMVRVACPRPFPQPCQQGSCPVYLRCCFSSPRLLP